MKRRISSVLFADADYLPAINAHKYGTTFGCFELWPCDNSKFSENSEMSLTGLIRNSKFEFFQNIEN